MLYLSDTIYITVDLSSQAGQYLDYNVRMKDHFSTKVETIYMGHIYAISTPQNIYLNDILSTHLFINKSLPTTSSITNYIVDIDIVVGGQTFSLSEPVIAIYKDPQIPKHSIPASPTNLLNLRTNILPTIPYNSNFPIACLLAIPTSNTESLNFNTDGGTNIISPLTGMTGIIQVSITNSIPIGTSSINCKIGETIIPIANVDQCGSRYFLYWYDRTGALQCQPFKKNVVMSEEFKNETKMDMINNESLISKSITTTWSLNSDWLSYNQYKAFESIFTSGYLYLYDSSFNEGYEVIVTDKEWVEKTLYNKNKLFNLSINVQQSRSQNILY